MIRAFGVVFGFMGFEGFFGVFLGLTGLSEKGCMVFRVLGFRPPCRQTSPTWRFMGSYKWG